MEAVVQSLRVNMSEKIGVEKIAELSRITLTAEEAVKFEAQVSEIVEYNAKKLAEVSDLPEKTAESRLASESLGQEDEPRPSLSQENALGNAPQSENGFVVVPRVLD